MKMEAAVLWGLNETWSVEEVELDGPAEGEVLVKLASSGLCHSDEHLVTGDIPHPLPVVGGHEGAGVVEEVGPGVSRAAPATTSCSPSFPPAGAASGARAATPTSATSAPTSSSGPQLDGTYRFHARGEDVGQMCLLGTFSPYTVCPDASVVKVDDDIPLRVASLVGCGVTTGCGTAINSAGVRPATPWWWMGIGGIGANAVQGARCAGARTSSPSTRCPSSARRPRSWRHPHRRRLRRGVGDRQRAHPWPARRSA